MKKYLCGFCLIIAAILIGACFSPWSSEEGNLSITWSNTGNSREALHQEDLEILDLFEVTLKGPGGTIKQEFTGVPGASFSVTAGTWSVTVKGKKNEPIGGALGGGSDETVLNLKVMGIEQIEVKAGKKTTETINMYNADEVDNWEDLFLKIENDGDLYGYKCNEGHPYHKQIITLKPGSYIVVIGDYNTIEVTRPIILVAEEPVTITRGYSPGVFDEAFFKIIAEPSSSITTSLTLGLPGMTGTITLDGYVGEDIFTNSIINVGDGGDSAFLIMNDGVTIKNNRCDEIGGGVNVAQNAVFAMKGGIINNNTAGWGGGVYIEGNGKFEMTGGEISGNTAYCGGGVYVDAEGIFEMNGGEISDNKAETSIGDFPAMGGGIYVAGNFTMNGGTIIDNKAVHTNNRPGQGGGVYLDVIDSGSFTMNGGTISGNTASGNPSEGGGVYISYNEGYDDNFKNNGGNISGNTPAPDVFYAIPLR